MSSVQRVHFAAFTDQYEAVVSLAESVIAGLPTFLRGQAEAVVPQLLEGDFCRLVALLPYWVADLLDTVEATENRAPASVLCCKTLVCDSLSQATQTLALAQLMGCWSYLIQDAVLDGQMDGPGLLPLAAAFHTVAIRYLEELLPGAQVFWQQLERLTLRTAEAQCWELGQQRLAVPSDLERTITDIGAWLSTGNTSRHLDRLADRSTLLQVAVAAQLALRGHSQEHPLGVALGRMLRAYTIARQLGDDSGDWVDDLGRGRVNLVAACIAHRMKEVGAVRSYRTLDVDRMAGYYLYDDDLFAELQRVTMEACAAAGDAIAVYQSTYLMDLVNDLADRLCCGYEQAQIRRSRLRALLAPLSHAGCASAPLGSLRL